MDWRRDCCTIRLGPRHLEVSRLIDVASVLYIGTCSHMLNHTNQEARRLPCVSLRNLDNGFELDRYGLTTTPIRTKSCRHVLSQSWS